MSVDLKWKSSPAHEECPICGKKGTCFSRSLVKPSLGRCWNPPSAAPQGWISTRNPNVFTEIGIPSGKSYSQALVQTSNTNCDNIASPSHRNDVYRELISNYRLSTQSMKELMSRGFTRDEILSASLGDLKARKGQGRAKVARELIELFGHVEGVPGFFVKTNGRGENYWTITGTEGWIIPSTDADGNIRACQIRTTRQRSSGPKYTWLSKGKGSHGTNSGSPAGVLFPKETDKHTTFEHVFLTEGFFKALAIRERWNIPAVWIGGVSMWESALEQLSVLDTKKISIAFDTDIHNNPNVQKSLLKAFNELSHSIDDADIEIVTWTPSLGKGIDDAILKSGLTIDALDRIERDQILTSITPAAKLPNNKYLRLLESEHLPAPTDAPTLPSKEECWKATNSAIKSAFVSPPGVIHLITAGTGYGKTTAICNEIHEKTLIVTRNYDETGKEVEEALEKNGVKASWFYGRQPKNCREGAGKRERERSRIANCLELNRAIEAIKAGHNPCLDCSDPPRKTEEGDIWYSCGYRKHKDEMSEPPLYGLAVPKVALQKKIIDEFETIIFDDIPELIELLSDQRELTLDDIVVWQKNNFSQLPIDVQTFIKSLRTELSECLSDPQEPSSELRKLGKKAKETLRCFGQDYEGALFPCEEPFGDQGRKVYPKAWLESLLKAFAEDLPIDLTANNVTFWTARPEIIDAFRTKRVIILDATVDTTLYKSLFGMGLGFQIKIPEFPKNLPRIIQVPDILWSKEQVKSMVPEIQKLAEKENAFIITRAGDCVDLLDANGHIGRHERGLNDMKDYKSGILAGHMSLPSQEAGKMAQGVRAICRRLNVDDPTIPALLRDDEGMGWQTYHDKTSRYKGLQRNTFVHQDPLAEHIKRHRHTSTVLQTWGRLRGNKLMYLLDGKPLYSSDPDHPIFVTIQMRSELGLKPKENRGNNKEFQKLNKVRALKRQKRIMEGVASLQNEVLSTESIPSLRMIRKRLGRDGGLANQNVAQEVKQRLHEIVNEKRGLNWKWEGVPHRRDSIYDSLVRYTPSLTDKGLEIEDNSDLDVPRTCDEERASLETSFSGVEREGAEEDICEGEVNLKMNGKGDLLPFHDFHEVESRRQIVDSPCCVEECIGERIDVLCGDGNDSS